MVSKTHTRDKLFAQVTKPDDEKENQEVGTHKQSETNSHLKNKRDDKWTEYMYRIC